MSNSTTTFFIFHHPSTVILRSKLSPSEPLENEPHPTLAHLKHQEEFGILGKHYDHVVDPYLPLELYS